MRCSSSSSIGDRKTLLLRSIKVTDNNVQVDLLVGDNLANRSNRLRPASSTLTLPPIRLVKVGLSTASLHPTLLNAATRNNEEMTCCKSESTRKETRSSISNSSVDLSFLTRQRANIPLPPLSQANLDLLAHRSHHRHHNHHHHCRPSTCCTMTSPARHQCYVSQAEEQCHHQQYYQAYPTNNGQCDDAKRGSTDTDTNSPGTNQQKISCSFAGVVERVIRREVRRKQQSPGELLQALYDEYCCHCTSDCDDDDDSDDDDDDLYDGDKLKAKYLLMRGEFNERVKQTKAVCKAVMVFKRKYNSSQ